jgi:hypothetical protein
MASALLALGQLPVQGPLGHAQVADDMGRGAVAEGKQDVDQLPDVVGDRHPAR